MKKVLAMLLALVLVLSLSTVAFAEGSGDINSNDAVSGGKEQDVTVIVSGVPTDAGTIYYLEISWELTFTYSFGGGEEVWDPVEHKYVMKGAGTAGWTDKDGTITVKNHSNKAVTVTPGYSKGNNHTNVSVSFGEALSLAAADQGASLNNKNNAPSGTIAVTASGTPDEVAGSAVSGKVTLTIS